MAWQQLTVTLPSEQVLLIEEQLLALGALSITLQDAQDEPILEPAPNETPLWSITKMTALFEENDDLLKIMNLVQNQNPQQTLGFQTEFLPDQEWEREWLKYFKPLHFGHDLWIVPTGFEAPNPDGINIVLDPGLAFGTGTHPTTAMCLTALAEQSLQGTDVIDYGCGSGILAIAAAKLGAQHVWAVDYDPQAVIATVDNAQRNQINLAQLSTGSSKDLPEDYQADVVVANILTNALVSLATTLVAHTKTGGTIILSGILAWQSDEVIDAYNAFFDFEPAHQVEDWVCLRGIKR